MSQRNKINPDAGSTKKQKRSLSDVLELWDKEYIKKLWDEENILKEWGEEFLLKSWDEATNNERTARNPSFPSHPYEKRVS
jgi:hypothetical protein